MKTLIKTFEEYDASLNTRNSCCGHKEIPESVVVSRYSHYLRGLLIAAGTAGNEVAVREIKDMLFKLAGIV